MAVIFDEVVGTVEPEASPDAAQPAPEPPGGEGDPMALRRALRRLDTREARLRAD